MTDEQKYRTITIDPYIYGDVAIYNYDVVVFHPGMTVLLGCNGSGKTTLMRQVKWKMDQEENLPVYWYDVKRADGELGFRAQMGSDSDTVLGYLNSKFLSEGEQIKSHLESLVADLGRFVFKAGKDGIEEAWIFFDSLDSGWSIDNCRDFVDFIDNTVLATKPSELDLYILMAANSYEFAKVPSWRKMDVQTLRYLPEFESYEAYSDYVMDTYRNKQKIWSEK